MGTSTVYVEDARGYPQGELFFMHEEGGAVHALVYNTTGLNPCPADKFDALDAGALAKQAGYETGWKNPRWFWMMDHLTAALVGEPATFEGLDFNMMARMEMPAGFTPEAGGQAALRYRPGQIRRVSTYEFLSGSPVSLLRSPDAITWVMQTYTDHLATDLTEADLPSLGDRLQLGEGWQFKAKTLERTLVLDTQGLAHIVADDLENMYQGCTDDVANYDPWE
jgi:hypothetical protein